MKPSLLFVVLTWLLVGCDLGYYWQAASGHFRLLDRQQSIQQLLSDNSTDPTLRRKFVLLQQVREFAASQLKLPRGNGYTSYVAWPRTYVSALVSAAPAFELEPKKWCYWVVGCQSYRGYFDLAEAQSLANSLSTEGWDVALSYASAYSTLGYLNQSWLPDYFADPVLSTFLERSETQLTATLIHEMAHQVVYVSGDTAFNESFATFVETAGTLAFLEQNQHYDEMKQFLQAKADQQIFREWIADTIASLEEVYASAEDSTTKMSRKKQILEKLKLRYQYERGRFQQLSFDQWFSQDLNNAHLLGVQRYHNLVPAFETLFIEQKKDWDSFYESVQQLADRPSAERNFQLQQLLSLANGE